MVKGNMASNFHRNGIYTGLIDYYCLVCENYLKSEEDVKNHIEKPVHEKSLNSIPYYSKYKNECIRKTKMGYYCEFCNDLLPTEIKVQLHVGDVKHVNNKGARFLKRVDNTIIAFDDVVINETSWNSLSDKDCAICDNKYDNEDIHKNQPQHLINLLRSKVEFDARGNIYRKIDTSFFQCLTCNIVVKDEITAHFEDEKHKKLYQQCRTITQCRNHTSPTNDDQFKKNDNTIDNQENIPPPSMKNDTNTNVAKKPENPKKNQKAQNTVENKNPLKFSRKNVVSDEEICKILGAKDYIFETEMSKYTCILCGLTIPTTNHISQHLNSHHHQVLLQLHKQRIEKQKANQSHDTPEVDTFESEEIHDIDDKSKLLEKMSEYQKNDIVIRLESETAFCKKCSENIDFSNDSIENHVKEHKMKVIKRNVTAHIPLPSTADQKDIKTDNECKNQKLFTSPVLKNNEKKDDETFKTSNESATPSQNEEEEERYAKENHLLYKKGKTSFKCLLCRTEIPSRLKCLKEHVSGATHKKNIAQLSQSKEEKAKPKKDMKLLKLFIDTLYNIEHLVFHDIIINKKICINIHSYHIITISEYILRCQICEETFPNLMRLKVHINSSSHKNKIENTSVITSLDTEFVREIQTDLYHCGFCNLIQKNWNKLEDHLNCSDHRENKDFASWRLITYLPQIRQHQYQEALQFNRLISLFRSTSPFN